MHEQGLDVANQVHGGQLRFGQEGHHDSDDFTREQLFFLERVEEVPSQVLGGAA